MSQILIVLAKENENWIISKIVNRISQEFRQMGHVVDISSKHQDGYDFVFWSLFRQVPIDYVPQSVASDFFLITHVDDSKKLHLCKQLIKNGLNPICMSKDSAQKISNLLGLNHTIPSVNIGSDLAPDSVPKMKIIMSSIVYPDGRKNESWLADGLPSAVIENVEFHFLGRGWEQVVQQIQSRGGEAIFEKNDNLARETYEASLERFRSADLLIYTGFDEGSLSVLDAHLLGKDLLVSSQGFHLDLGLSEKNLFSSRIEFYHKLESKVRNFLNVNKAKANFTWNSTATTLLLIFSNRDLADGHHVKFEKSALALISSKERRRLFRTRVIRAYRHFRHLATRLINP